MINRDSQISIRHQAQLLGFSRGMVYYQPKPLSQTQLDLMNAIDRLHMQYPFMGAWLSKQSLLPLEYSWYPTPRLGLG